MRRLLWLVAVGLLAAGCAWTPRAWLVARLTNPLPRVGALRGAATVGGLPGTRPATLWADHPDQAAEVRALQAALHSATPVLGVRPGPCGPLEGEAIDLLPVHGAEVTVEPFWTCRTVGPRTTGVRSPDLVVVSTADRRIGVFRAPGLAAAFTHVHWPAPTDPPVTVTPSVCASGCTLTVVGHDFLDATARVQVGTDRGWQTLATVPTHDGDFTWTGAPPADLPPGTAVVMPGTVPQLRLVLLPPGMDELRVTAGPAPRVAPAVKPQVSRYPPTVTLADAPGATTTVTVTGHGEAYATNGGDLLRTVDGGRSWTLVHDFPGMRLLAADAGWAVAVPSAFYCTGVPGGFDGGSVIGAFAFSCLLHSGDGGRTWAPAAGAPPAPGWERFFSPSSGVVVTRSGAVYRTADGGATWTAWGVVPWGDGPRGPAPVDFASPDFGVANLLGQQGAAELAVTTDGGRSWTIRTVAAREIVSVSTPAAQVIWMVAQTCDGSNCAATLERSTDGGATWSAVDLGEAFSTDLPNRPFQVVGQSPTAAWLVVPGHQMLHTDDGGQTWTVAG